MIGRTRFSLAFGSGTGLLLLALAAPTLLAQSAVKDDPSGWQQIFVDDHCQVMDATGALRSDADVCRLDGVGVQRSSHLAAKDVDGMRQHALVNVTEQTYLLQDIHSDPVVFVVAQQVPDGWHVDSDPQPKEMRGNIAIFRVTAQAGQIVRLHVGMEHAIPMDDQDDQ